MLMPGVLPGPLVSGPDPCLPFLGLSWTGTTGPGPGTCLLCPEAPGGARPVRPFSAAFPTLLPGHPACHHSHSAGSLSVQAELCVLLRLAGSWCASLHVPEALKPTYSVRPLQSGASEIASGNTCHAVTLYFVQRGIEAVNHLTLRPPGPSVPSRSAWGRGHAPTLGCIFNSYLHRNGVGHLCPSFASFESC